MSNKKINFGTMDLGLKEIADKVVSVEAKADFGLMNIPLDKIRYNPKNDFGMRDIDELANSLKMYGQVHNIVVRTIPESDGEYELISGERRHRAATMLGWETIAAKVVVADDTEAEMILIIANLDTRELNDIERSKNAIRLAELIQIKRSQGEDFGGKKTREVIAEKMNIAPAQVQKLIKLQELIPEFKKLVEDGVIGLETSNQYAQMPEEQQRLVYNAIQEGLSLTAKQAKELKDKLKQNEEDSTNVIEQMKKELANKDEALKKAQGELDNNKIELQKVKTDAEQKFKELQSFLKDANEEITKQKEKFTEQENAIRDKIKKELEDKNANSPETAEKVKALEVELESLKKQNQDKVGELEEYVKDLQDERKQLIDDYEKKLKDNKAKEIKEENIIMNTEVVALCRQTQRLLNSLVAKVANCKSKAGFELSEDAIKALSEISSFGEKFA